MGENTSASPVQPMRSSRWGQSVGTSTKLPFWPHSVFRTRRFTSSFPVSSQPFLGRSEYMARPVKSSGFRSATPSTLA